jgi:hypothetical protein
LRRRRGSNALSTLNQSVAAFLKLNQVNFVRCWFPWNFFEKYFRYRSPRAGEDPENYYQFPLDDFVERMNEVGVQVIGVVGNGYSRFLPFSLQKTNDLNSYLPRLVESSTQIVRHYKDRIKTWQIENEPNWWRAHFAAHWRKGGLWLDERNQEPILRALYNVVRTEDPNATIIVNLEGDSKATNWKFYSRFCDILGLDFYPNYAHPIPSDATVICDRASEVRRETGLPTFVVETGYPTGPSFLGYSEKKQTKYIRSACTQAFSCDAIKGLGWFRFSDSYWRSFPFHENYFGLLTKQGRLKPGWYEYAAQIRQMR